MSIHVISRCYDHIIHNDNNSNSIPRVSIITW